MNSPLPIPDSIFTELAEALYGRNWKTALAEDLGLNLRTVQRWSKGEGTPGNNVLAEMAAKLRSRHASDIELLMRAAKYLSA